MNTINKISIRSNFPTETFTSISKTWGELKKEIDALFNNLGKENPLHLPNASFSFRFTGQPERTILPDDQPINGDLTIYVTVSKVNSGN